MRLPYHTAFSAAISGILYMIFKSWALAVSCFITGIFIDLDHIIDVLRENGRPFKIKNFFRICHDCQFNRVMLIWHGWEWLFLWSIAAWLTDWNPWMTGALIGLSQHLVIDAFSNNNRIRAYSLLWRWKQNFYFDKTFPQLTDIKYNNGKYASDKSKI